jgi:hypothetical protein
VCRPCPSLGNEAVENGVLSTPFRAEWGCGEMGRRRYGWACGGLKWTAVECGRVAVAGSGR